MDRQSNGSSPSSCSTFALATLGCKVNQYESQAIRELLLRAGYREMPFERGADIFVINTCAVTAVASEKGRKLIRRATKLKPGAVVIVTGCDAHAEPDVLREIAGVTHVIPKSQAAHIPDMVRETLAHRPGASEPSPISSRAPFQEPFELQIARFAGHARAFLKIEDGCEARCSYCIVPRVRGPVRSRPLADILAEARRLVENGHKEIVLTGIHLGAYGRDFSRPHALADVARSMLKIEGLKRIRLSSLEVNEVSDHLLDVLASDERFCPHFHLPLQSGDADILRAMNRAYSPEEYLGVVERIRARIPNPSFTTDILVGFPGETEEQFQNTLRLCREVGFSRMHVFPFSPRPGTPAAEMPNQCPPSVIRKREEEALALADELALAYKTRFIGRVVEPLVETRRDRDTGLLCGYTERYLKVLLDGPDHLMNQIVSVRVREAKPRFLLGAPI